MESQGTSERRHGRKRRRRASQNALLSILSGYSDEEVDLGQHANQALDQDQINKHNATGTELPIDFVPDTPEDCVPPDTAAANAPTILAGTSGGQAAEFLNDSELNHGSRAAKALRLPSSNPKNCVSEPSHQQRKHRQQQPFGGRPDVVLYIANSPSTLTRKEHRQHEATKRTNLHIEGSKTESFLDRAVQLLREEAQANDIGSFHNQSFHPEVERDGCENGFDKDMPGHSNPKSAPLEKTCEAAEDGDHRTAGAAHLTAPPRAVVPQSSRGFLQKPVHGGLLPSSSAHLSPVSYAQPAAVMQQPVYGDPLWHACPPAGAELRCSTRPADPPMQQPTAAAHVGERVLGVGELVARPSAGALDGFGGAQTTSHFPQPSYSGPCVLPNLHSIPPPANPGGSAERTPVGAVHKAIEGVRHSSAGKSSNGRFFSPLDDAILAQIDSLERKAVFKASQRVAEADPGDHRLGSPSQQGQAAALFVPGGGGPAVPWVPVRDPTVGGDSTWSGTPDSAVERMLQEVDARCGAETSRGSPAPIRNLAFALPAGAAGADGSSVIAAAAATPADSPGSGKLVSSLPTSHLGRSAMKMAQAGAALATDGRARGGALLAAPAAGDSCAARGPTGSNHDPARVRAGFPSASPAARERSARVRPLPGQSHQPQQQRQQLQNHQQLPPSGLVPAVTGRPGAPESTRRQCASPQRHHPHPAVQAQQHPALWRAPYPSQTAPPSTSFTAATAGLPSSASLPVSGALRGVPEQPALLGFSTLEGATASVDAALGGAGRAVAGGGDDGREFSAGAGLYGPAYKWSRVDGHDCSGQPSAAGDEQTVGRVRAVPGRAADGDDASCGAGVQGRGHASVGTGGAAGHAGQSRIRDRTDHGGAREAAPRPVLTAKQQQLANWVGDGEAANAIVALAASLAGDEAGSTAEYLPDEESEGSGDEDTERNIPLLSQYVSSNQKPSLRDALASPQGGQNPSPSSSPLQSPPANQLDAYLPPEVSAVFREVGVTGTLYDWQAECLCQPGVLKGRNLVYCAPTSGGKSLVAEVLMVRRVMATGRPAMLVLPFVSLCSEKAAHLTRLLSPLNKEVKEFYGGMHSHASLGTTTGVIVCTIEKANILINRMLEDQTLNFLSCLVVDELHMVGDEDRGYQLELLLTKLMYAAAACDEGDDDEEFLSEGLQVIGMSATLPNVDAVARWLKASLYQTQFRPVPLKQFIKVGREIRDEHRQAVRTLETPPGWEKQDPDHTVLLAKETVDDGHSVLIFCCSKNQCSATAKQVSRLVEVSERRIPVKGVELSQHPTRASVCEELGRIPGGADPALLETMPRGVAFHHAGLSSEERDLVERAYKCGAVSVLCATSTLAAGVNLPARRVIFKHPYVGWYAANNVLDGTRYRQMAGRAGRAGVDTFGESILVARDVPLPRLEALMVEGARPIESCLLEGKKGMKRAMLEVVAAGVVKTPADVDRYIRCTLLHAMNSFELVRDSTIAALKWLGQKEHTFIFWDKDSDCYECHAFGKAVLASGLPPEMCMTIKADLERARESFVMTTELHLTYLCVPVMEDITPDWARFYETIRRLQGAAATVMTKVGVNPGFAMQLSRGLGMSRGNTRRSEQQMEMERICKRFWVALILTDLIQEVDMLDVQQKYAVPRGTIQGLQDRASRFASMVAAFCEKLGWYDLEALITKFQSRVLHGVRQEILALSEIPFVKSHTARLLYKAGLRTPEAVAAVPSVDHILSILNAGAPPGDRKGGMLRQRQALKILRGARELLNRRARELREQALHALQLVQKADAAEQLQQSDPGGDQRGGREADVAAAAAPAGPEEHCQAVSDPPSGPRLVSQGAERDRPQHPMLPLPEPGDAAQPQQRAQQAQHVQAPPAAPQQAQQQQGQTEQSHAAAGSGLRRHPAMAGGDIRTDQQLQQPQDRLHIPGQRFHIQPQQEAAGQPRNHQGRQGGPESEGMGGQRAPGGVEAGSGRQAGSGVASVTAPGGGSGRGVLAAAVDAPEEEGGEQALLHSPPEQIKESDPWDLGGKPGPHVLTSAQQVQQLKWILEGRYPRFAFLFDVATGTSPCAPSLPPGPSIARGATPSKAAVEQPPADAHCGALARVEGVALCWREGQAVYIPLRGAATELRQALGELLASPQLEKATFDLKQQLALLRQTRGAPAAPAVQAAAGSAGPPLDPQDPLLDVRIAAWMATPEDKRLRDDGSASLSARDGPYSVEALLRVKAGQAAVTAAIQGFHPGSNGLSPRQIDACKRAAVVRKLAHILVATLEAYGGMLAPLRQAEMPLVRVLVDMEANGIAVNEAVLVAEKPLLARRLRELEEAAHSVAQQEFNLGSPSEVSHILFEQLKLAPPPNANTLKSGGWSTGADVLRELSQQHPLPALILEHRKLSTLQGRFLNSFCAVLRSAKRTSHPGGLVLKRIHGSLNQTCTDTGRFSMDEPNLQTVPRPLTYLLPASQPQQGVLGGGAAPCCAAHQPHTVNLRRAFVAPPGSVLLSADYRQLELRLMAHFSQDAGLLRIFSDPRIDPFQLLAAQWTGLEDPSQVTPDQRSHAKQLTYGILYGMGKAATADELGCSEREAESMMASLRASLPGVEAWRAAVVEQCRRDAFVSTISGRRRWLPHINSPSASSRSQAERQAVNTVCQGSAADIMKAAMVLVHRRVAAELPQGCCRLVLNIHDELLFEVDEAHMVEVGGVQGRWRTR